MKSAFTLKLCILGGACLVVAAGVKADDSPHKSFADSAELTLDQLVNIQVTSVSKTGTELIQSPAAISVITEEDIRSLGITTIPDALRLVPGVEVSQNSAHEWSVGVRGFGDGLANKVQVLVDGRTAYSSAVGGVHWDVQDVVLEDLDRIEVIRGPGATLWGANAMNGVINIITKSAKDTQGILISTDYGTVDQPEATVRYGGQLATNVYYRVYVKYFNRTGSENPDGSAFGDPWAAGRTGFRLDWEPSAENTFTFQGDYYSGQFHEVSSTPILIPPYSTVDHEITEVAGGNILGRWTHAFSDSSQTTLQLYYDYAREAVGSEIEEHHIYDVDLQHHFALGSRNDLVAGAGYRFIEDRLTPTPEFSLSTPDYGEQLVNVFLQDSFALMPEKLTLTAGAKIEHNSFTGIEWQPSGRLLWQMTERQVLWGAVSRAVRTPTLLEQNGRLSTEVTPPATLHANFGNPNLKSEALTAYELGYRISPTTKLNFDLAAFYNHYDKLVEYVPATPFAEALPAPPHTVAPAVAQNTGHGYNYGLELSAQWQVSADWRLSGGYSLLKSHFPADINADDPEHQLFLRTHFNLTPQIELNSTLHYFSRIPNGNVSGYLRWDAGVCWRPVKSLEVGLYGQNLLTARHWEFDSEAQSQVARGVYGKITWRY